MAPKDGCFTPDHHILRGVKEEFEGYRSTSLVPLIDGPQNIPLLHQRYHGHGQTPPPRTRPPAPQVLLHGIYLPKPSTVQSLIKTLSLEPHIEGGYFVQTDASPDMMPPPYASVALSHINSLAPEMRPNYNPSSRHLHTTTFYFFSSRRPLGYFHRNRSRIIHTLHSGRGRYVLVHKSGRVETFVVGHNIQAGEKLQWVVEGGVWKASFLLADDGRSQGDSQGLLISETVAPRFEYTDHEFLTPERA